VEVKANDSEEYRQDDESRDLNGFAAKKVGHCNCTPVAWDGSSADQDEIANSRIVEGPIHVLISAIANCAQDGGAIKS
jgi:hypothetical protein